MKKTLQLSGLDCPNCAAELEREIAKMEGITFASVAFVTQKLTVEYQTEQSLTEVIAYANSFEDVRVLNEGEKEQKPFKAAPENQAGKAKLQRRWIAILVAALLFMAGILCQGFAFGNIFFVGAYLTVAMPVWVITCKNVVKGKLFDENFLMVVASIGAMLLGEITESVLVMWLYQIGEALQGMAVESSRRSVTDLMHLKSESANVFRGREQMVVSPEEIKVGDILMVKAGELVPVDGVLIDAKATLDVKSLTGEALPCMKKSGEELLSGSINAGNTFTMRATRLYQNSAVKKILELIENASSAKATPEKFITKFARWYTPIVCACAVMIAVFAPLAQAFISERALYFKEFSRWANSALIFLVISCPCALVISVPLTYFSGIGACAKQGILVKGATHLDDMARAQIFAFDKTGTLTEGKFTVCQTYPAVGVEKEELLAIVATVEKCSSHPIAGAFTQVKTTYKAQDVTEKAGYGLRARIHSSEILVGNAEWLREYNVSFVERQSAYTLIYVAQDGVYMGVIEVGDNLRAEAKETLEELERLGIERKVMLTGDSRVRAQKVADEAGIYEVNAQLLPDEKLRKAEELKGQGVLVYVGDGVNDAPVMAVSDCAVSMGKLGSAAAVEASDFVLIADDLKALPRCVKIARKTRAIVLQNILFSITMKGVFMVLGACGVLPLWSAVFADVGVMLLAVFNSFRVRKHK